MRWVRGNWGDLVHFSFIILVKDKIDSHALREIQGVHATVIITSVF